MNGSCIIRLLCRNCERACGPSLWCACDCGCPIGKQRSRGLGSWALGELVVTLGRATLWVRTRRYDADARAGAAQHVAALGGFAPPQVDLLRIARARSLAPTTRPVIRASEAGTSVTSTIRTRFKQRLLLYVSRTRSFAALLPPWHPYCTVLTVHRVGKRPPNPSKITPFSGDSGLVFHSALRSASPPPGWRALSA